MGFGPGARRSAVLGGLGAAGLAVWGLASTGALSLDLGWGRSRRPLGPQELVIAAPRSVVFDVIAEPYLHRTPRALSAKLRVLERGTDMVLAAHFTPLPAGLQATTVETVRFDRPERVSFRLVRGPVPEVEETFELQELGDGQTRLVYRGELSADLWAFGRVWGRAVARTWERTVATSLEGVRAEAERLARPR